MAGAAGTSQAEEGCSANLLTAPESFMGNQAEARVDAPSGWARDLEWRMSQAKPEDTARGVFFKGTLEALRELGDESAVRSCVAAGGEERFVDAFRYPIHSLLRMLSCAAIRLAPGCGGGEEALRELGRRANADYLASSLGRTVKMMTQGSPRRLMENAANIHRQTMSFGALCVEWTGPSSGRVVRRGDFWPAAWQEGALEYLLSATGGRRVRVEREWVDGLDGGFVFAWG